MSHRMKPTAHIFVLALFAGGLLAQTIELRNGEVAIGRVVKVTASTVEVEIGFPKAATRTIQKSDITPVSLYTILAARVEPGDAEAHTQLAEVARGMGLRGHAIAEFREAARLDPKLKATAEAKVMDIRTDIARALVEDAKEAMEENRFGAARLTLSTIDESYGDTPVGREATHLLQELKEKRLQNAGLHQVSASELERLLKRVAGHVQDADDVKGDRSPHGGVKAQRTLERVVRHLEKANDAVSDVAPPDDPREMAGELTTARESVQHRLVEAYLTLGTVFIQRRAIPSAEEYCEKAGDLDPENSHNHRLHNLILQARIATDSGFGRGY